MYVLNIASAMKKVAVDELRYFIFENCYKGIEFAKGRSYYSMKHLKNKGFVVAWNQINRKCTWPHNAREHYQSFIKKKKISKTVKMDYSTTKNFWKPKYLCC